VQRNEVNFWNGKVSSMRRDLEQQQMFAQVKMEENKKLVLEVNTFMKRIEVKDREGDLLKRQIRSLEEDNERKNKMYDMMNHSMSETKKQGEELPIEADYSFTKHDQARAEEHRAQLEKKGWKTAETIGASFG
jgi:hypothetical protein